MAPEVLYEVREHTALITLNRPAQRNAVNGTLASALASAIGRLEQDDQVRVGVLTGAGDVAFSAGADLKAVAAGEADTLHVEPGGFAGFVRYPRAKPVIAAVNGFALAGGCEIALACDTVVASTDASFGLPEVTRGLVAAAGGAFRLLQAVPPARAVELMLTGTRMDAEEAYRLGLVAALTAPKDLLPRALGIAARIAANAPLAVRETLSIARAALAVHDERWWALSDEAARRMHASSDALEGARAFAEKRQPHWTGT